MQRNGQPGGFACPLSSILAINRFRSASLNCKPQLQGRCVHCSDTHQANASTSPDEQTSLSGGFRCRSVEYAWRPCICKIQMPLWIPDRAALWAVQGTNFAFPVAIVADDQLREFSRFPETQLRVRSWVLPSASCEEREGAKSVGRFDRTSCYESQIAPNVRLITWRLFFYPQNLRVREPAQGLPAETCRHLPLYSCEAPDCPHSPDRLPPPRHFFHRHSIGLSGISSKRLSKAAPWHW